MDDMEKYLKNFSHISFRKSWEIPGNVQYVLGACEATVNALRYLPLSPKTREKMLEVSLIKGAMATTAIEGSTLTEEEVRAIHEGRLALPQSRKYLEQEVKNVLEALNKIYDEVVKNHRISPVTTDLIRSFNQSIGKDLGDAFESVPGEFRPCEVVVGSCRAPDHRAVSWLMDRMCDWLHREFGYSRETRPSFAEGVVEAIVAHVYLVWIHPFCDGNGRTARLLEFYLLLRCGLPDICAHILSNHYNETRSEYYRRLSAAGKSGDLTEFIAYAAQGLLDGLAEVLMVAQRHQIESCWRNYVYDKLDEQGFSRNVRKRYAKLLTEIDVFNTYTRDELSRVTTDIAAVYARVAPGTILRDVRALVALGLLRVDGDGRYSAETRPIIEQLPRSRTFVGEPT